MDRWKAALELFWASRKPCYRELPKRVSADCTSTKKNLWFATSTVRKVNNSKWKLQKINVSRLSRLSGSPTVTDFSFELAVFFFILFDIYNITIFMVSLSLHIGLFSQIISWVCRKMGPKLSLIGGLITISKVWTHWWLIPIYHTSYHPFIVSVVSECGCMTRIPISRSSYLSYLVKPGPLIYRHYSSILKAWPPKPRRRESRDYPVCILVEQHFSA